MKVGFVGMGIMGRPMALNLVRAGFDVIVHSRRAASLEQAVDAGATAAGSVAELAAACDAIVLMLPDSPDVEQVAFGSDGVIANAAPGTILIDMSTVSPATDQAVADAAADRDLAVLDAPVSGGEKGAIDGTLSIMVGGATADVVRARPVFEAMGATIEHVGPLGSGQTVKAANQLIVGGIIGLVSEALLLLEACDVDPEPAVRVLAGGLAGSKVLDQKAASMLARRFEPGFRIDLHHKDLGIVLAAARDAGLALPVTGIVAQLFVAARAQGFGSLDHSGIIKVVENLSVSA